MRLLSFFNQVEATLVMLRPDANGWHRRMNPGAGEAAIWHPRLKLSVHLRVSPVGEDRHGLRVRCFGPAGDLLRERTCFCATSPFDWQNAAELVAELIATAAPEPADEFSSHEPLAVEA